MEFGSPQQDILIALLDSLMQSKRTPVVDKYQNIKFLENSVEHTEILRPTGGWWRACLAHRRAVARL